MTVKELIEELKQYNQDANLAFVVNPTKLDDISFDIETNPRVLGSKEYPEIILTLQDKSRLESISELLKKTKKELVIKMDKNGLFVFKDNQLARELELKYKYIEDNYLNSKPHEYIKMLLRIL